MMSSSWQTVVPRNSQLSKETTSTTKTNHPYIFPSQTLDLHGYRREDATERVAEFVHFHAQQIQLQQQQQNDQTMSNCWVTIITGSGAHSREGGPVLRHVIQRWLDRRCMVYKILPGRGSFSVDVTSYRPIVCSKRKEDTKLQLVPNGWNDDESGIHDITHDYSRCDVKQSVSKGIKLSRKHTRTCAIRHPNQETSSTHTKTTTTTALIQRSRTSPSNRNLEESRFLAESKLEYQHFQQVQQMEEQRYQEALRLSHLEQDQYPSTFFVDNEHELQVVLEKSVVEHSISDDQLEVTDEELQRILAQSEADAAEGYSRKVEEEQLEVNDEELQKILQQSIKESEENYREQWEDVFDDNDDVVWQQILAQSAAEAELFQNSSTKSVGILNIDDETSWQQVLAQVTIEDEHGKPSPSLTSLKDV
jgi:Smr domain